MDNRFPSVSGASCHDSFAKFLKAGESVRQADITDNIEIIWEESLGNRRQDSLLMKS